MQKLNLAGLPVVKLRPIGRCEYELTRSEEVVGVGYFKRRRTGSGVEVEAWIRAPDGTYEDLNESYFVHFVRHVRAYY